MRQPTPTPDLKALAVGAAVAATAVLAACGSSGPSRASYASQADGICATYNAKLHSLGSQLEAATSPAQQKADLNSAVTLAQQGTNKLKALKQPSGDDTAINKALAAQQQQVTDLQSLLSAVETQNKAQAQ